jgi:vitamin B12 transporter
MMCLVFSGFAAWAADAEGPKEKQTVEDLVVTATRTAERLIDVPVTTEVITREKIELSGAVHVGDLIGKYITGHYHKYSGLLSPVGLRSFRTESHGDDIKGHVLILVDGHRVGTGNAAKINVDRIERVEVTKGPSSALYGSAAMGGVINLITRKGEGDPSATLSGDYGSFDYYKGQVSGGGEVNDRFRFHATASYEDIGDYDDPEFGTVYNSGETKKNFGMNLSYAFAPNHEFRLGGNYADITGETPSWENYTTYGSYDEDTRKNFDKSHGYADLEYNGDFFDSKVHWRGLGYYLWDRNHWKSGSPDPDDRQSKYTDTTLGTDQQFSWHIVPWNTLVLGFNLEKLEKESEAVSGSQPSAPYTPGMEYNSQAYFLQNSLDLWDNRINIVGAVRHDRFDVKTRRPETGDFPEFNEKSETYDHTSPKLGMGIKFFDELLRVRANVGEGFKSPSADQLSAQYTTHSNRSYVGNPDLDPETSLTYDIGFDIFHSFFTFNAGYFHTDYEDKIVKTSTSVNGQSATTWENSGDADIAGFDLALQWWIGRTFDWTWDLSLWSNATFNTTKKDKETDEDLRYISDYEIKSGLETTYGGFSGQMTHTLVGPQMITNYDSYPYVDEEKDSFDFWDLTLRYRFATHWQVRGSVLNLFDDRVEWVRGYLMPERNYRVGVSYTF